VRHDRLTVYDPIVSIVLDAYPHTEAIYLFGSFGTADERPSSDVDIALPPPPAASSRFFARIRGSRASGDLLSQGRQTCCRCVMVGFRNTAVHQCEQLNLEIVKKILTSGLDHLLHYGDLIVAYTTPGNH
jgi:hypothetical protein